MPSSVKYSNRPSWLRHAGKFWRKHVRRHWREFQWILIGCLWVATPYLGYVGFSKLFAALGETRPPSDILYLSLQLFVLESGSITGPKGWELELSRLLAPVVVAYTAVQALAMVFQERLQSLRLRFIRNHTVVCGLGRKGFLLTTQLLERGDRVVVIEQAEHNVFVEQARESGATVLMGNAANPELLRKSGVYRAKFVVSLCGDDGSNAEVAVRAKEIVGNRRKGTLTCIIHIVDPRLCALLREQEMAIEADVPFRIEFFNVFDSGARVLLKEHPAYVEKEVDDGCTPHILVVGLGRFGESLVVHQSMSWWSRHSSKGNRLLITIIDRDAERKVESLRMRYPQLDKSCDLIVRQMDIRWPEFERGDYLFASDGRCDTTSVYICFDNDPIGLAAGLMLRQQVRQHRPISVVVRMAHDAGLATLLRGQEACDDTNPLHAFALLDRTCTPDLLLGGSHERIARAIHEEYLHQQEAAGQASDTNPTMVPWDDLPEYLNESNRLQADHVGVKLRAIGYGIEPLTDWDAETGAHLATMESHSGFVLACAYSPDGSRIVSASLLGTLNIWDALTSNQIGRLEGHGSMVNSIAYSPDGRRIVSASDDMTVKIWDAESGAVIATLTGHSEAVQSCAYSPDGRWIVSGSEDKTLKIWDARTGSEVSTLPTHQRGIMTCSFSPDGRYIASAAGDLRVWNIQTGDEVQSIRPSGTVWCCAYSPDGRHLISACGRELKVWEVRHGAERHAVTGHTREVETLSFSPDGRRIVSGSRDGTLKIWNADTGGEIATLTGHTSVVWRCTLSPDGRHIVSASWDGTLKIWDAETGGEVATLRGHSEEVRDCAYSPDGRRIVSASADATLRIWDASTAVEIATLWGCAGPVLACRYSLDGRRIFSESWDKTLRIWDAESGSELAVLAGHSEGSITFSSSPDGRHIASVAEDSLKIWDAETGAEIASVEDDHTLSTCAYSPDGSRIISTPGGIKTWDAGTGKEIAFGDGHSGFITYCVYSPDGRYIVAASETYWHNTLKVLDAKTGSQVATFVTQAGIHATTVRCDGRNIALGDRSGLVYILSLEGVDFGPIVVTSWRSPIDGRVAFGCPLCRTWSGVPESALGTEVPCPNCGKPMKLNSFTINADWRPVAKAWRGDDRRSSSQE